MYNPVQSIYSEINLNHSNLSLRTHSYCSKNTLTLIAVIFAVGTLISLTIGGLSFSASEIGIVAFITGGTTWGLSILFFIMAVKKHLEERRNQNHPPEGDNPPPQPEIDPPLNQQSPPRATDEVHTPVSPRTDPQPSSTNTPQRSDPLHGRNISTLSLNEIESLLSNIESLTPDQVEALTERQELLERVIYRPSPTNRIADEEPERGIENLLEQGGAINRTTETFTPENRDSHEGSRFPPTPTSSRIGPITHPSLQSTFSVQEPTLNPSENRALFNGKLLHQLTLPEIESILANQWETLSESKIQRLVARQEFLERSMSSRVSQNAPQPTPIQPFVNPPATEEGASETDPSPAPSNPISESRQENTDEQYGTEKFNIEDGLFQSLPEDLIHRLLMREDARQRLIQLRKNQPSLYTVEPLPAYDPRYVREHWENYEFYNTETFRWEPLQVRNRFSGFRSRPIESVGHLGNSSYLDIFIFESNQWFTLEEVESLDSRMLSSNARSIIEGRRDRLFVRKKNPEGQQASVSVPSTPPTPSPILMFANEELKNDNEVVRAAIRQENQVPQAQGSPSDGIDQVNETPNDLYVENTSYFKCHWERYQISYDNGVTWEHLKVLNEESGINFEEIEQYENQEDGSVDIYVLNEYWFNNDEIALLLSTKINPFTNEAFPPTTLDLLENRTFPLVRKIN